MFSATVRYLERDLLLVPIPASNVRRRGAALPAAAVENDLAVELRLAEPVLLLELGLAQSHGWRKARERY